MQPRQIALVAVAAAVGFAAAFGIGKATNKSDASGAEKPAGTKAAVIEVGGAPAIGSLDTGGAIARLRRERKREEDEPTQTTTTPPTETTTTPPPVETPTTTLPPPPPPPDTGDTNDGGPQPQTGGSTD